MKKTSEQPKRLTLDRTTIALLGNGWDKRKGANLWNVNGQQSTLPECDVTNTGTSGTGITIFF